MAGYTNKTRAVREQVSLIALVLLWQRMFGHLIRHIVNNDDPVGSPVVAGRDCAKSLLAGRVPLAI